MFSIKKILNFFSINKSIGTLLFIVIAVGMGEKMAERFLPVYLISLGASSLIPGFLNGLDNFLSAVYSIPGGWISHRYGYKKALMIFNSFTIIGYLIVILFANWVAVVIGSFFFLSWTALSLPAVMDLLSSEMPKNKRVMGVSLHSLFRRVPMALGPIFGGLMIDSFGIKTGIRSAFIVAAILSLLSIIFQEKFIHDKPSSSEKLQLLQMFKKMPKSLLKLLYSDIFIRFAEQMPYAYIAIWAMQTAKGAGVSGFQFGLLTAIEMTVALLIYIPVAYFADKGTKKPFVLITYSFFTAFPLIMLFGKTFGVLTFAFIIRGLKEFGEPTRKTMIMELAPEGYKAAVFGAYYFIRDVIVSISAVVGAFLWNINPELNLITSSFFGLIGMIILFLSKFPELDGKNIT